MEGTDLLVEMLLDELSCSFDQGLEKVKALRKETSEHKKEIANVMQSKQDTCGYELIQSNGWHRSELCFSGGHRTSQPVCHRNC